MSDDTYVVAARYPLTIVHIQNPLAGPGVAADGDPIRGWTECDLPMVVSELWQAVQRRDTDQVCPACTGRAEDVQETLL